MPNYNALISKYCLVAISFFFCTNALFAANKSTKTNYNQLKINVLDTIPPPKPPPQPRAATPPPPKWAKKTPTKWNSANYSRCYNFTTIPVKYENLRIVKDKLDALPRFPACEDSIMSKEERILCADKKMKAYIYANLKYPNQARELGIEGTAVISFVVNEYGEISDIAVVKKVGGGCAEAAAQAVAKMALLPTKWIAGRKFGKPVKVRSYVSVKFQLL